MMEVERRGKKGLDFGVQAQILTEQELDLLEE
jgi:hypothetical protein